MHFLLHFCFIVKSLFLWQLFKITVTTEFLLFSLPDTPLIILFSLVYSLILPNVFIKFCINHGCKRLLELEEVVKSIFPKLLTLWMRKESSGKIMNPDMIWLLLAFLPFSRYDPTILATETCQAHFLLLECWTHRSSKWPLN